MSTSKSESFVSLGFCSALTLIFITLKLCNVIDWSWWWVLSPSWISIFLAVVIVAIWLYFEVKSEKKKEAALKEYREKHPEKKSKFMERLDEAIKESEARRNQNQN